MIAKLIKPIISSVLGPIIEKIPDPNERKRLEAAAEENLLESLSSLVQGQLDINVKEAQHGSVFVAGWRPSIGWVCGIALAYHYVVYPFLLFAAFLFDVSSLEQAPQLDLSELYPILLGMLGLGGLRTYEKRFGVARRDIKNGDSD